MATTLPDPSFIDRDPAQVTSDNIALYEQAAGKTLQPAQPEMLMVNQISYRETLMRIAIQEAAKQCLLAFATGSMLDYLGELVSCSRLAPLAASTSIQFTLVATQGFDVQIPGGTTIVSKDNLVTFTTDILLTIPAGQLSGAVSATADVTGVIGNGYAAGDVSVLVTPIPNVQTAANTTTTSGGADAEGDDHYRDRIRVAPESFSVAGPRGAYIYWAKTAHPDIIDVWPTSDGTGNITLHILATTGAPSQQILDAAVAICSGDSVRPIDDKVSAVAATEVDFAIVANVTLYTWCTDTDLEAQANIEQILTDYVATLRTKLGTDLVLDQIKAKITAYTGVYNAPLASPVADQALDNIKWLNCTAITVNIVGRVDG